MKDLRKHGGVLSGVPKRIDVPGDTGTTTRPKRLIEEPQAHGHLVDDGAVVGGGLVAHTPAAVHELQATWRERSAQSGRVKTPIQHSFTAVVRAPSLTSCLTVCCMLEGCCFHQR